MKPLSIFLGYDPREHDAYNVAQWSIIRRSSQPVLITPLYLPHLTYIMMRHIKRTEDGQLWCPISEAPMSTEFATSRFCVPFIQETGWALFMDCDVLCLHWKNKVETEDGPKYIRWIVENKYTGRVLSLDHNGNFVWKRVTGHSVRPNTTGKKFVMLDVGSHRSHVICTEDHRCAVIKDPLQPQPYYIEAKDTTGLFSIRDEPYRLYNEDQVKALIGIMLGDGHISANNNTFTVAHGHKQSAYLEWTGWLLNGQVSVIPLRDGGWTKIAAQNLLCKVNAQTKHLRRLLYPKGKKTVENILSYIDERSLAFWYMDDGSLNRRCGKYRVKSRPYVALHTEGFSQHDRELIKQHLKDRWGLHSTIQGKRHSYNLISPNSADLFLRMIAPYVHPSMEYKLPDRLRGGPKYNFNNKRLGYAAALVTRIKSCKRSSRLFDISVEDTHNFVANGAVVHNCIADIAELFALADDRYAVMVVKHDQAPGEATKMNGQIQTYYERKNWSSVVLWNCSHEAHRRLTKARLNYWPGRDLHAFKWLEDDEIGELPQEWNHLVGVNEMGSAKLLHFTLGTPDVAGRQRTSYDYLWEEEKRQLASFQMESACA